MGHLAKRIGALEGRDGGHWQHEDWIDYMARKEAGEDVSGIVPRPSPGLEALAAQWGDDE